MLHTIILSPSGVDDTATINSAVMLYRNVILAAGTFNIYGPIILPNKPLTITGAGIDITNIVCNRPGNEEYTSICNESAVFGGGVNQNYPLTLSGFTLDSACQSITNLSTVFESNSANGIKLGRIDDSLLGNIKVLNTGLGGISVGYSDNVLIDSCVVNNCGTIPYNVINDFRAQEKAACNGITLDACTNSTIQNCISNSVRDNGMTLWNSSNSVIQNCIANNSKLEINTISTRGGMTIETIGATNSSILNCFVNSLNGDAIQITSPNATVDNIECHDCAGHALATRTDIHNGYFNNIRYYNAQADSDYILLGQSTDTEDNYNITLSNCIIERNGSNQETIRIYYIRNSSIINNSINITGGSTQEIIKYTGSGSGTAKSVTISGNTFTGSGSAVGLRINTANGITVSNNTFDGCNGSNILIASDSSGSSMTLSGNTFNNYTSSSPYGITNNSASLCSLTHSDLRINTPDLSTYNFASGSTVTHKNVSTQLPETHVATATPGVWNLQ